MQYGILFSGQGAQRAGMGVELMADSLFLNIVQQASEIIHLDLEKIMRDENDELDKTEYVQPALVTVSYGIYKMLQRDLPELPIAGMAGLSLGEYAALFAGEAVDFSTGLQLLVDRAKYMQADADKVVSTMAAILNPDVQAIEQLCANLQSSGQQVYIANYNSPQQLVIGGPVADVKAAAKQIKEHGLAKRAIVLKVNGAFHTPLFNGARAKMKTRLASVQFKDPLVPVISNTTMEPFQGNKIGAILERQLAVPTHFGDDVKVLVDQYQVNATLEIGPGKTLSRFAQQVAPGLSTHHIGNLDDYQKFVKEYQDGTQG
ncbi:ACP S-malonyltransferase [Limosilactobacillus caecicola]|uniref:ACP S-malonyltransferase n=1 Tax=Limosilactobacillus caecicola TaxID=2941332 RepID=UPI00203AD824|nr:ACP S-malonyltransferase [Limosilactobacillus caecicola]